MNRKLVIKLDDLPNRLEKISHEELSRVFGGCKDAWLTCDKKSDCCSGHCIPMAFVPVCG